MRASRRESAAAPAKALGFPRRRAWCRGVPMAYPARVGDVIAAKYRVERILGRGGMGVVVAARHLRLRERVAIKILLPRPGATRDLMARSVREARLAMRIRSEHVVRVYDIGMLETGEPFLVMEHLSGTDLRALLDRQGSLRVEDAIEYLLQAIEAIAEAHARGIVHRDLKPGNLFLARRADGTPLVKVLDFGIAKSDALEASARETAGVAGTPVYMAPEQMRSGSVIDARTDVWGLGVTLYALLTGEAPFRGGSLVELHERILGGAPSLRAARPDAPEALEAILLRCMAKNPADRFGDVAELSAALADLAPEHVRFSARRASRILAAAPLATESVDLEDAGEGEQTAPEPSRALTPTTEAAASASWQDAALSSDTTASAPAGPSPVDVPSPARTPAWRVSLALVGAALGGSVIAFAALQDRKPPGCGVHTGATYYVDPVDGDDLTANGSTEAHCSFRTITAALQHIGERPPAGTIVMVANTAHVVSPPETFPIAVPENVTVQGPSESQLTIVKAPIGASAVFRLGAPASGLDNLMIDGSQVRDGGLVAGEVTSGIEVAPGSDATTQVTNVQVQYMQDKGIVVMPSGVVTLGSGVSSMYNGYAGPTSQSQLGNGLVVYGRAAIHVDEGEITAEFDHNHYYGIWVQDSGSLTVTGTKNAVVHAYFNYHGLLIHQTPSLASPSNIITALVVNGSGGHGIVVTAGSSLKLRNSLSESNLGDGIVIRTPAGSSPSNDVSLIDLGQAGDPGGNSFQPSNQRNSLSGICLALDAKAGKTLRAAGNVFEGIDCATTGAGLVHEAGVCAPHADYGIGPSTSTTNKIDLGLCH
jgi:serine/threonine-protein kinase